MTLRPLNRVLHPFTPFAYLLLLSSVASSQITGSIDKEVSAASRQKQSSVHLAGPLINYPRLDTLSDLVGVTTPVVVTILGRTTAVEPLSRNDVRTYYLTRVDDNILSRALPLFAASQLPAPLNTIQTSGSNAYLSVQAIGGSVTVAGVQVTIGPAGRELTVGGKYLLFLYVSVPEALAVLRTDGADCLRISNDTLVSIEGSKIPSVVPLLGVSLSEAESAIRASVH